MFSSEHRSGIFVLSLLIVLVQVFYYFYKNRTQPNYKPSEEEIQWLAIQQEIDSLKGIQSQTKSKIYPFNPNFITDYKGYMLGMSVAEIDKLHQFRAQDKFVNSAQEFQKVTGVSDSLLAVLSPYFKFPDWVTQRNNQKQKDDYAFSNDKVKKELVDANLATKEQWMAVYGIGEKLSEIILRDKEKFGAFASIEQLQYVWGISPEVYQKIQEGFFVPESVVNLKKININTASVKELAAFPYFNYKLAKSIVTYRSMNGEIYNFEDLTKINEFPVEKIKIIALYLEM
ncbi:ComEA family DNA-binding protein [Flavobacterium sp. U410]